MNDTKIQIALQIALWNGLKATFERDEIDALAFSLGIRPDEIAGATLSKRARSLVTYCANRGRLRELLARCREERDNYDWPRIEPLAEVAYLQRLPEGWGMPDRVVINKQTFTLGRASQCDLEIKAPEHVDCYVSRNHAVIRQRDEGFKVFDDQSKRGTFVNSLPVDEEGTGLRSGDIITLGGPVASDQVFGCRFTLEPLPPTA